MDGAIQPPLTDDQIADNRAVQAHAQSVDRYRSADMWWPVPRIWSKLIAVEALTGKASVLTRITAIPIIPAPGTAHAAERVAPQEWQTPTNPLDARP